MDKQIVVKGLKEIELFREYSALNIFYCWPNAKDFGYMISTEESA